MSEQQHMPGGHYSGANPVPTIKKFLENLDRDKKDRDKHIDDAQRGHRQDAPRQHHPSRGGKPGTRKTVTDPTTGKEVQIEDVALNSRDAVANPLVTFLPPFFRVSRANVSSSPFPMPIFSSQR